MDNEKKNIKHQYFPREMNVIPDYDDLFNEKESESSSTGKKTKSRNKKKNKKFLSKILKKNSGKIFLSSLFYAVRAAPVWIISIVSANVINIITACIKTGEVSNSDIRLLIINAIVMAVSLIQNIPTTMINLSIANQFLRDTGAGLKSTLVRKLQRLSITYYKEIETGKLQSKFLRDLENTEALLNNIVLNIIPVIINLLISIGISIYKSGVVTLFFLCIIPVNVIFTKFFSKKIKKNNRILRKETENVSSSFTRMLDMMPVSKAHGLENDELNSFNMSVRRLRVAGLISDHTNSEFGSIIWVVSNLFSASCLFFCAYLALKGKIQVGDVVLYQSLFSMINNNILALTNAVPAISSGLESVRSISEIMTNEDVESNSGRKIENLRGDIEFDHVYYKYPNSEEYVVKDLNLKVKAGECIAFVGGSGSGKSTVMNMIIGFLQANKGSLLIDDKDIKEINLTEYRHHISVVSQNNILFNGTLRENITFGLDSYSEEDLQKVLEMADINEFLPEIPGGINGNVGEEGGRLSGGQKQRITIARALIRNPEILIMDEATSALDNISEYHVQKAISELIKNRTTFIVAHRLSTIRNADRIIVMEQGVAVEQGTYEELMEKHGKFYELKNLSDMTSKEIEKENK